ncbi:MAG TPA: hypothetical protein DEG69_10605, partial [Flavobacteriaceae bacterium]|nr:hypothetical protein [Flavobacteriaceae bacterium]
MREAAFAKQNKDKWLKFESVLRNNIQINPDELSALYVEVTDHLSYAQTFFPNSNTAQYLNNLSVLAHQKIYKTKRESRKRFITFYTKEFPLFFAQYHKQLLIAFITFALFAVVGAYSAATDSDFVRLILGNGYVNMTLENIENGDPMAVYKEMESTDMFLGITINNIRVALFAFSLGVFLSLGTLYIIMRNAVMLGSFQYFFYDQGLLWESARTIWIHGTIEISVIIVAACAGLVMGNSILFPGTYTRLQSFVRGAKDGLKILISTIPFFIIAGFLEGFVTRHT